MAELNKNYKSNTGVEEFYYGVLDEQNELTIKEATPELVDFLKTITVTREQSIEKAHGSNKIAEMATVNGTVTVEGAFHKLPKEDKIKLLGLPTTEGGVYGIGQDDVSPYVACVFAMTYEDGHKEWVGLPKGKFIVSELANGQTKQESEIEWGESPITAEFMDRKVNGFDTERSAIFAETDKGDKEAVNEFFNLVFGKDYPDNSLENL